MAVSLTPRALTFDLDGTLWSCDDVIARAEGALYQWLTRHFPRITEAHDPEAMRRVRRDFAERRPELAADLTALRRISLEWHAERAGYDPALGQAGVEVFLRERQQVTPYPDVRPVLERLAGNYPLVALTNGNADVRRTELGDLFHHAFSAADVGAPKPHPAMYRAACDLLGIAPAELVHVGDDPVRDVQAARSFGAGTVWVNRHGVGWPEELRCPHYEIATLHELLAVLGSAPGWRRISGSGAQR